MKKNIKLALVAIAVILFTSCENRYAEPEYIIPSYELDTTKFTLMTIAELKALSTGYALDSAVIRGIVVGDDRSGNLYKSIYIQDETGGLNLSIDKTNLYNIMPVGQEVYVELEGLYLINYGGIIQLGGSDDSRYDWAREYLYDDEGNSLKRFYTNGLPDSELIPEPRVITSVNEITSDLYSSLVTLEGVWLTSENTTENSPYDVADATANQNASAWVEGYIVGVYNSDANPKYVFGVDTIETNILIADEIDNPTTYLSVQLPSGDIRSALNLNNNPDNLGKKVMLYGSLETYCGIEGLKSVSYAEFDGVGLGSKLVWAEKNTTTNQTATFVLDNTEILIRTSGYSNFYGDAMPSGVGNITGILSVYSGTDQFYIRDRNDIDFAE